MKTIIISASMKDAKWSSSKRLGERIRSEYSEAGIESEVIHLKDFDYEATTEGDNLAPALSKIYDASMILFVAPIIHASMTLSLFNVFRRLKNAHAKGLESGVDIFKDKRWHMFVLTSSIGDHRAPLKLTYKNDFDKKYRIRYFEPMEVRWAVYNGRHHGIAREELDFMKPLNVNPYEACLDEPMDPVDKQDRIQKDARIKEDIDEIVSQTKELCREDAVPACSQQKFLELITDHEGKFGRGMTLSSDNLERETVERNIKYVATNEDVEVILKGLAMIGMKERADRAGRDDLATMYFRELHRLKNAEGFRSCLAGNERPSNY